MLIRKNTKLFKSIHQLIDSCQNRSDRDQLVRLYITKAGDTIERRISIEGIQGDAALFYEMTYQTVMSNLNSAVHQLHVSDESPGIYFFHTTSNKVWDETPFEFDEAIKREFPSVDEFPVFRKKSPATNYVLPSPPKAGARSAAKPSRNQKKQPAGVAKPTERTPTQPDFKLTHDITFANLDKLVFRQTGLTKREVLSYYDKIAEYLLPYLKDRALIVRMQSGNGGSSAPLTATDLFKNDALLPPWVKAASASTNKDGRQLLCNDRDHLLLYVEMGCLQFNHTHCRIKQQDHPDLMTIAIDSPESKLGNAIEVALATREILTGLKLPSFVKSDGLSGLHVYIPLDGKSDFQTSRNAAKYLCELIRLKIPDLVTMKASGYVRGKVSLDYNLNHEKSSVIAPYSLVTGESPVVATPLLWDEIKDGLRADAFDHKTIFSRLKDLGDPFESLFRKKVNAEALFLRLEENYIFLF